MPKIRLLASDIDGTLLNSKRQVSEANKLALARAAESGIVICLASGRLVPSLRPIADAAGVKGPIVTCNGSYVESESGEVLLSASLEDPTRDFIAAYARENSVNLNIYQPYRVLASHASEFLQMYESRTAARPEVVGWERLDEYKATKIIFIDHPERNKEHYEFFAPHQAEYGFDLTVSEPEYLEFLPHGVNKRTALQALAAHLNLQREEIAAIGDYLNDLEMVTWAGIGAAMANGAAELRQQADLEVPGNDEDGLAHFVDHILELNRNYIHN